MELQERPKQVTSGNVTPFEVEHACKDGTTFTAEVLAKTVKLDGKSL